MAPIHSSHLRAILLRIILAAIVLMMPSHTAVARPGDKPVNRPYADLRTWRLGFSVGMHVQDLSFTHNGLITPDGQRWSAEVPSFSPGFCINVFASRRLHKYAELRFSPGLYFGSKGVEMIDSYSDLRRHQDVKSTYVALPLDVKLAGDRMRNARPFVTAGMMATFDISKKRTEPLMFNTSDLYLCLGLGSDFYLPYFKLIPEIKFCFGLTDVLRHNRPDLTDDPETFKMTQSLKKVKSNMVMITFYFE